MDHPMPPHPADPAVRIDHGPFLRQEGRPPRQGASPDGAVPASRRYPRVAVRVSRVPAWIGWVARRIGPAA